MVWVRDPSLVPTLVRGWGLGTRPTRSETSYFVHHVRVILPLGEWLSCSIWQLHPPTIVFAPRKLPASDMPNSGMLDHRAYKAQSHRSAYVFWMGAWPSKAGYQTSRSLRFSRHLQSYKAQVRERDSILVSFSMPARLHNRATWRSTLE